MHITIDSEANAHAWTATLQLSKRFGLTAYDPAYLELAGVFSNTRRAIEERGGFAWFAAGAITYDSACERAIHLTFRGIAARQFIARLMLQSDARYGSDRIRVPLRPVLRSVTDAF